MSVVGDLGTKTVKDAFGNLVVIQVRLLALPDVWGEVTSESDISTAEMAQEIADAIGEISGGGGGTAVGTTFDDSDAPNLVGQVGPIDNVQELGAAVDTALGVFGASVAGKVDAAGARAALRGLLRDSSVSGSVALTEDVSFYRFTLVGAAVFDVPTGTDGGEFRVLLIQDGTGGRTPSFTTGGMDPILWVGGEPTWSSGPGEMDVVTISAFGATPSIVVGSALLNVTT